MRKCEACGYLLLGDGDGCKHCGAPLPDAVPAGALVAGGSPPPATPVPLAPPAPAAPPVAPVPPVPPPAPRESAPPPPAPPAMPQSPYGAPPAVPPMLDSTPAGRDYWTPPAPLISARKQARSKPRAGLAIVAVVAIVSMALGWVAVDRVFMSDQLPPGTSAFVAGHGVAFSSPDHTFDAQFPMTPTVEQRQIPVAASSATISLAHVQTDDYEVVAGSMVSPVAIPSGDVGPALHKILNAAVVAEGAKVVSESQITEDGVPGVEITAKVQDGYAARFMMLMSGTHIYLLGAHAKHGTDRIYNALVASLVIY